MRPSVGYKAVGLTGELLGGVDISWMLKEDVIIKLTK
jgi:hypothetical protein